MTLHIDSIRIPIHRVMLPRIGWIGVGFVIGVISALIA
jgi:hypothetical protein